MHNHEKPGRQPGGEQPGGQFVLRGQLSLAGAERYDEDLKLHVQLRDARGKTLASGEVDGQGSYQLAFAHERLEEFEVVVTAAEQVQQADPVAYRHTIPAGAWVRRERELHLQHTLIVPAAIWQLFRPRTICISGRVRKQNADGSTCNVPFVKVEIFDVDREACWWDYIRLRWPQLIDRAVIRLPDLVQPPIPDPIGPVAGRAGIALGSRLAQTALNPQPLPPRIAGLVGFDPQPDPPALNPAAVLDRVGFDPQPDPPLPAFRPGPELPQQFVGELRSIEPAIATRLSDLTLSSTSAPWLIFPGCFYSRQLVCTTYTDCDGDFSCCFRWFPLHMRRGRLRFDWLPDIIVRITQVIDGVETVIYADPYTSTRWNSGNAYLNLTVDDPRVLCGPGCTPPPPSGAIARIERIGSDPVYLINRNTGCYEAGSYTNVAYGSVLGVFAQFGDALAAGNHYYRLSYAMTSTPAVTPPDSAFTPIYAGELYQYRRPKGAPFFIPATHYKLGPVTLPGVAGSCYQIRDLVTFDWLYSDEEYIGSWDTRLAEPGTGVAILRLEVFDAAGNKLGGSQVTYQDNRGTGTDLPPPTFPGMGDQYDLVIMLDNQPLTAQFTVVGAMGDCGVVPFAQAGSLQFQVNITQPSGRIQSWDLDCYKGTSSTQVPLAGSAAFSVHGLGSPVNATISGAPLAAGLTSTCAFALKLVAYAHIRDGVQFFRYEPAPQAIAIEKCS